MAKRMKENAGGVRAKAPRLTVRRTEPGDVPEIVALSKRVYPDETPYDPGMIRGQMAKFPEGQFVAVYDGKVAGLASTFRISEEVAFEPHDWGAITGGGYASQHDRNGDWLYGMEVIVHPEFRRLKIGQRLYDARKRLAQELGLKGIAFGGRLPGLAKRRAEFGVDAEAYFNAVRDGVVRDPVAQFQMRAGFEPVMLLENYLPEDKASGGMAALMAWRNPEATAGLESQPATRYDPQLVRVTAAQLQARPAETLDELVGTVQYFVKVASSYRSDFIVFPELFSLAALAGQPAETAPDVAIRALAEETPRFIDLVSELAIRHNVNVIAGSHPTLVGSEVRNVAYACLRDGAIHRQEKLHPTPDEREVWRVRGGYDLASFDTDCGQVAMAICYDVEFPEVVRRLADEGARLIFTPYSTDTRQGHLRVRLCAQARAIENQVFIVTAGNVGNLPNVENMDINYAQSGVYTPVDFDFARDGVAAEASENVEMMVTADLDLGALARARAEGSVRNLRDRRFDLYRTIWKPRRAE